LGVCRCDAAGASTCMSHDKEAMRRWLERVGRVFPN
jgi:hypothetical protein